jgi:hypothetical protein
VRAPEQEGEAAGREKESTTVVPSAQRGTEGLASPAGPIVPPITWRAMEILKEQAAARAAAKQWLTKAERKGTGNSPVTVALAKRREGQRSGPMTPYQDYHPHRQNSDQWGPIPLLLGAPAIALIGTLVLTNSV